MSKFLTRDDIFATVDTETREVFVPQWKGTVNVKALTARERDQFEVSIMTGKGKNVDVVKQNLRAKLLVLAVVDEDGKRVFDEADIRKLGDKNAAAVDLIYGVAAEMAGISEKDEEELVKNSVSDQSDDSFSV